MGVPKLELGNESRNHSRRSQKSSAVLSSGEPLPDRISADASLRGRATTFGLSFRPKKLGQEVVAFEAVCVSVDEPLPRETTSVAGAITLTLPLAFGSDSIRACRTEEEPDWQPCVKAAVKNNAIGVTRAVNFINRTRLRERCCGPQPAGPPGRRFIS
jgi:hypothetical protein